VQHGRDQRGLIVYPALCREDARDGDQVIHIGRGLGVLAPLVPVFVRGELECGEQSDDV
jgi:hypothetical protein